MWEAGSNANTGRLLTHTTNPSQEQHIHKSLQNSYGGENDKLRMEGGRKQLSGKVVLNWTNR